MPILDRMSESAIERVGADWLRMFANVSSDGAVRGSETVKLDTSTRGRARANAYAWASAGLDGGWVGISSLMPPGEKEARHL